MDLTIIIPTWNNSVRLRLTLESISRCVVPSRLEWELIVVHTPSGDDTQAVVRSLSDRLPIKYLEEPRYGGSLAKNTALKVASGRLIIFTDDDITPCSDWLVLYWSAYREKPTGFYFGGPLAPEYEIGKPEDELLPFAPPSVAGLDWGTEERQLEPTQRFLGGNWACPADAVLAVGGFDPRVGLDPSTGRMRVGDEYDLTDRLQRLGLRPWYLPRARVVHHLPREKCGLRHIANKAWAQGEYVAYSRTELDLSTYSYIEDFLRERPTLRSWCDDPGLRFRGVPLRFYRKAASLWVRRLMAKRRGSCGYEEYLAQRFCLGMIDGLQRLRREGGPQDLLSANSF